MTQKMMTLATVSYDQKNDSCSAMINIPFAADGDKMLDIIQNIIPTISMALVKKFVEKIEIDERDAKIVVAHALIDSMEKIGIHINSADFDIDADQTVGTGQEVC